MDTIAETIKMAGFGKKKIMAKQIQMFDDKFTDQGETLLAVCASMNGKAQLYVTDKRILLHEIKGIVSNDETSIPLKSISSINFLNNLVYSTIEIVSTGNTAVITNVPVHIATEIKNAIENLRDGFKEEWVEEKETYEIVDDIRDLKELLDEGILTQEEFDAKKKQLLGL